MKRLYFAFFFSIICILTAIGSNNVLLGADQMKELLPLLKNKKVALVVNHTSCLSDRRHLLDVLIENQIDVVKIFAPEHGFRGDADAGEQVVDGKDVRTNTPVVSLYGKNKKPSETMLQNTDIVIFDIQDVGARFYTYISTMFYVMEACAENKKELVVLDRPNPHDFIDGPVLDLKYKSFVGMLPIPILHGVTIGELALMVNGEGWLKDKIKTDLKVIPMKGWKHGDPYSLPIKPSPNLPNDQSIKLYASLCFFEATNVSVGRGTYYPFQVVGYPNAKFGKFKFTPVSLPGFDKNPLQKDKVCYGIDLREISFDKGLTLSYLIDFYKKSNLGTNFFKSPQFMNLLSGTNKLQNQLIEGKSENEIRNSWKNDLDAYKQKRKKYVLYIDKKY